MRNNTFLVLKKELREVFRDKKSLAMMLIVPFMIPLLIIGMSALFDSEVSKGVDQVFTIGFDYELSDIEKELAKKSNIKIKMGDASKLKKLCQEEKISLYITKNKDTYIVNYDQNKEKSNLALTVAEEFLNQYKIYLQNNYLEDVHIDSSKVLNILAIDYNKIGEEEDNFYASYVTSYAFLFVIMAITISATYPATDTTAGEKERGTLETLLTFPIKSKDIIMGKFLSVSLSSVITGILSFILAIISLIYAGGAFDIYKNINIIPNVPTIVITIFIIICYSLLISGLCIAIASKSKTFKEAQSALTPITFISFFPGMIAFLTNIKTNAILAIIPFINYTQIFTDVNAHRINYFYIILMVLSTFVYIVLVIGYIIKQYKSEKILFSN